MKGAVGWLSPSRLVLACSLAMMDTAWLVPWVLAIDSWSGSRWSQETTVGPLLLLIALAGRLVAGSVSRLPEARVRRLVILALGLVVALAAVRLTVYASRPLTDSKWLIDLAREPAAIWTRVRAVDIAFGAVFLAWVRGAGSTSLGRDDGEVVHGLGLGVGALAVVLTLSALVPTPRITPASAVEAVLVFLIAGFLSVALARIEAINTEQRRGGEAELHLGTQWVAMLGVALLVLGGIALLLGSVLTLDLVGTILRPIGTLLDSVLSVIIYAVALPLGYLIEIAIWVIRSLLAIGPRPPQPSRAGSPLAKLHSNTTAVQTLSPELLAVLRWGTGLIAVVLLAVIAYRALTWSPTQDSDDGIPEAREFIGSWSDLRDTFRRWLAALLGRLPRRVPTASSGGSPLVSRNASPAAQTIFEIYREFLQVGSWVVGPRRPAQTPSEYERKVLSQVPAAIRSVHLLTRLFVATRYGEMTPDSGSLTEAREALDQFRAVSRESSEDLSEKFPRPHTPTTN